MICPKCKVKNSSLAKYCIRCGYLFPSDDISKYGETLESKLINEYFYNEKINFYFYNISLGFLIFNFAYAFLKKQYSIGIISFLTFIYFSFIIEKAINSIINSLGFFSLFWLFSFLLCLFILLYYCFKFNDFYIDDVRFRINKIIKDNPNCNYEELKKICKKDSRGNWILAILGIIIFLVIIC